MKNVYVEITNVCNLDCSFCPGHNRKKAFMSASDFGIIADKLNGKAENLFLHLMGEPLLHPELDKILKIADKMTSNLKITTNGTLLPRCLSLLTSSEKLRTVCISLHSYEANHAWNITLDEYLENCFFAADALAAAGKYAVFRLWNLDGGENEFNSVILERLSKHYPKEKEPWVKNHRGERISTHIFLEWGEKFDWPDITDAPKMSSEPPCGEVFCHGLLSQAGVLCDGTVVPCCLDRNGEVPLGNLFSESFEEILASPRAREMKEAMAHHRFTEPLCRSCGFAGKFSPRP